MEEREFGSRLRELRRRAGFSQRELADAVGVDFSYLSKIENGVMPSPSEDVIRRLAKVLNTDRDELLTLAGKLPSDIAQILKKRGGLQSLRGGTEKKSRAASKGDSFNKRLRELREKSGLSQGELARQVGINFTYLSKIENGVKPPPSEKVILRLAEALGCDKDELLTLAGKLPSDIVQMLKNREVLQSLRGGRTQRRAQAASNGRGIGIMKHLLNSRSLVRTAVAIILVAAIAVSLWFSSPSLVKALKIDITGPTGQPLASGTLGQTYYFKVTVSLESPELVPIAHVDLSIFNSANPTGYVANLLNLPVVDGGSRIYTGTDTGGGTANVTVAMVNIEKRYGYGYVVWRGYAYRYVVPSYGYGLITSGPATITYNIAWTPPLGWPAGNYKMVSGITSDTRLFSQPSSEFNLQTGLVAETGISQGLSAVTTDLVVVKANINRIKNPADNATATIPGGIGSYSATVSGSPSNAIQFLAVNGIAPFTPVSFNAATGVFSVASVANPIQPSNNTVAEVVPILTGSNIASVSLTITFQAIGAAGEPGLNVPEVQPNTLTFLRGNTKADDPVDIFDALFIAQYIVGQRTLSQIGALNAASVKHDGPGGDIIDIFDALFIAQNIVGQKSAYYQ